MESFIRGVKGGTIGCPKCRGKVGNFSWIGIQCSCGAWMAPAFAFSRSKVDVLPITLSVAPAAGSPEREEEEEEKKKREEERSDDGSSFV